ncbi:carbohydrate-binding family 9-like protein [Dysgonomonas sp. BGC7]|uniref:carbohydrate-binding family 9-like protein n=1 Tax=Dysgonomonas sp. BGC7 TaxID=1658008 RepID=UPI000680F42C|nr:carbohydrate-binding family 9-like protein [Dysgonomonas sp. BGC7]MBD8388127.1 hypothetical protein [Dysgonomonas sp. BGC7]
MLLVPQIKVSDVNNQSSIVEAMQNVSESSIATLNWPDQFPSKPEVTFKLAHNGEFLFLEYNVEEDEILAKTTEDNGPVWTDSCVEFFISFPDSDFYYNMESSCIGKVLLGYRQGRNDVVYGDAGVMSSIKRYPSLGTAPFEKKQGEFKWSLLLVIPVSAYWKSGLTSFNGVTAKANFFKCGDDLTVPHFLSWNPIATENPDFHRPDFFAELKFE